MMASTFTKLDDEAERFSTRSAMLGPGEACDELGFGVEGETLLAGNTSIDAF